MNKQEMLQAILTKPYKLFPTQREAVISDKRYVRVVAGAGAGKTETLTRRIAYLLLYLDQPPSSIVAFTFTERAAQSMKNRVYQRVAALKGEDACANLGEMHIGTIHSYCLRLLKDYFGYGNYEELDENQEMAFLMRHGWGMGLHLLGGAYSDNCSVFSRTANLAYDELLNIGDLDREAPEFYRRLVKYEGLLKEHKLLTFTQMIAAAVSGLEKDERAIANVKHLIVDEYQDINKAQERLIKLISQKTTLFVVGDPRQCIYRWRGSDESYFDGFSHARKGSQLVSVAENNRSCPEIVDAANSIATSFTTKYEQMKKVRKEKGAAVVVTCDSDVSEAQWVVNQVETIVNKDKACSYSNIAILLRSVSTSAEPFIEICKSKGIPYVVGGKIGLFRRDEAQVVGRLYAWLATDGFWRMGPFSKESIKGDNLLTTAGDIYERMSGSKKFPKKDVTTWKGECLGGKFKHFTDTFQNLLVALGFDKLDPESKLHAAILANLGRFNSLLTDFESSIRHGGDQIDWQKVWKGLVWYINSYASAAYEEQPTDDLRGVDAVQIMTVHQAKGLEWPVVFIPCMTARRFPSSKAGQSRGWQIAETMFPSNRYRGGDEDERKLFYVAVTRARDLCYLSYHARIRNSVPPSPFLSYLGKGVLVRREHEALPKVVIGKSGEQEEIQTYAGGEIIGYLRCPYFYRLREQWNYQAGLDVALGYGKSLHHCLRIASDDLKNGKKPADAISQAVDREFHLPYADPIVKKSMMQGAKKTLTTFVDQHIEDMKNIEEVEARLEFPVEKATITGRVDVILHGKDKSVLEVRDYKTSEEVTTFDESSLQVRLYTLGLRKMGRNVKKASIAYLDKGDIKLVDVSPKRVEEAKKTAEKAIKDIASSKYRATGKRKCNCDYGKICCYTKKT